MTKDALEIKPLCIFATIMAGEQAVVKDLLRQGFDVRVRDDIQNTLLHTAVLSGERALVELCVAFGVDVTAKNILGQTAYDLALVTGQREFLNLLAFDKGDEEKARAERYQTLLQYSLADFREGGHQDMMADFCREVGCEHFINWLLLPHNKAHLPLCEHDLLMTGRDGYSVIWMMAQERKLPLLFTADFWHQKMPALEKLWRALPTALLAEADLTLEKVTQKIVTDVVKQTTPCFKLKPPKK
jgi:hypothetical protein